MSIINNNLFVILESPWLHAILHVHLCIVRLYFDRRWNICVRAKSERYFCNPHTSGTRKRRPIFRYGQVGEDSFNSCSFHLAPSLQVLVSVSVPVLVTFSRIPRNQQHHHLRRRKRARAIVTEPESFADRSHMQAELLSSNSLLSLLILLRLQSFSFFFQSTLC